MAGLPSDYTTLQPLDTPAAAFTPAGAQAMVDAWLQSMSLTPGATSADQLFGALYPDWQTPAAPQLNVQPAAGPYADFFNGKPLTLQNGQTVTPQTASYVTPTGPLDAMSMMGGVVLPGMTAPVDLPTTSGALNDINQKYIPGTDLYNNTVNFVSNMTGTQNGLAPDKSTFFGSPTGVTYSPGTTYRLINPATGQVYGTANDVASLRALSAQGIDLANNEGTKASYALQSSGNGTDWGDTGVGYHYDPETLGDALKNFALMAGGMIAAGYALPAIGVGGTAAPAAAAVPTAGGIGAGGVGGIGAGLGGIGGAATGAAGVVAAGAPIVVTAGGGLGALGTAALGAGLAGAGALATGGAGSAGGAGAAGSAPQASVPGAATIDPLTQELVVSAGNTGGLGGLAVPAAVTTAAPFAPGMFNTAGLGAASAAEPPPPAEPTPNEIVVTGSPPPVPPELPALATGLGAVTAVGGAGGAPVTPAEPTPNEIVVTGSPAPTPPLPPELVAGLGAGVAAGAGSGLGNAASTAVAPPADPNEIVVTGGSLGAGVGAPAAVAGGLTAAEIAAAVGTGAATGAGAAAGGAAGAGAGDAAAAAGAGAAGMSLLDKIRAGLLGAGLLSSALGGGKGGSGSGGTIPAGLFDGPGGVGWGSLPSANIPGLGAGAARDMSGTDWTRYGYGPAQSFFNYVPTTRPNTSTAYTGYEGPLDLTPKQYAVGGPVDNSAAPMALAVGGMGHGRSDDVPSLLSDGEYVMDAETVALLGNGSNKAGAKALDDFRVNIRKQKGGKLVKGKISPDAKRPEQYLAKGRK